MNTRDILLVDDDIHSLHILSSILHYRGFDVRATSDGIEALEIMECERFRMLIIDLEMPKMSGLELAMKVRERHPDMHIVMVTGSYLPEIVEPAADAGISLVMAKPVDCAKLVSAIRSSLPKHTASD
ncbi:response regulator [Geomonas azotofigens]|uniref:response regulator n=1 Tax=Geomonas azotofigens TaxID=2843196 RepID=UPI001C10696B|nr:response regulator [Geomonas azotofigens]MBU5613901.1 response regulator [Geomonas azotofigens]